MIGVKKFHRTCKFYTEREGSKHCERFDCRIYCSDVEPEDYRCWEGGGNE